MKGPTRWVESKIERNGKEYEIKRLVSDEWTGAFIVLLEYQQLNLEDPNDRSVYSYYSCYHRI